MPNEYTNKVIVNNRTLIDLTGDTVTAEDVVAGKTAHDKSGAPITGTHLCSEEVDLYASATSPASPVDGDFWVDFSEDIPPEIDVETKNITENGTYTAPSGKAYSPVTVDVPTGTPRSSSDLTVSGATVTAPAGLYSTAASKSVASGTQGTPTATKSISGTTATVTPKATDTTGYITGTTKTGTAVTVTAAELVSGNKAISANGTGIDVTNYATVSVDVPSGGVTAAAKDVNFIDYDGTIRYSYTAAEFAALTAMPANPTHDGLTSQGWNWTLAKAKTYVAKYGRLWVGQMYVTDDGKTRVYIHLEKGRTSPMLGCCPNGTVDVDWGDGTAHDTLTGTSTSTVKWTPTHNYAAPGNYVIKLTVTGSMGLYGALASDQNSGLLRYSSGSDVRNTAYRNAIQAVEIGDSVTSISGSAFYNCYSLTSVTIPDSVTSIGTYAFYNCYSLTSVTIPDGITSIGAYTFYYCYSLVSVTIPDGVTSIGGSALGTCYSLTSVTIPDSVTSVGTSALSTCRCLTSVTIPDGVTSVGNSVFGNCYSLVSVTIPDGVTSVGTSVFGNCYSMAFMRFLPQTPPVVSNANAFSGIPTDCVIYVPHGTLDAYKAAANYPDPASYTYVEDV